MQSQEQLPVPLLLRPPSLPLLLPLRLPLVLVLVLAGSRIVDVAAAADPDPQQCHCLGHLRVQRRHRLCRLMPSQWLLPSQLWPRSQAACRR